MILDLDVGNTLTKWRSKSWHSNEILARGAVWTQTSWELADAFPDLAQVQALRISNVAGQEVLDTIAGLAENYQIPIYIAHSSARFGRVMSGYQQPERLGVDRWLVTLAGFQALQGCCVVDCGSAITIDFVDHTGKHLGGYITPGIRLMKQSLKLGTRNVPIGAEQNPARLSLPGCNTIDAVNHGIFVAVSAQINACYQRFCNQYQTRWPLVLTGGDASLVSQGLDAQAILWPDMVYAGLEVMFPLTEQEKIGKLTGFEQGHEDSALL